MKFRIFGVLVTWLALCVAAFPQSAPVTQQFSLNTSAITLPGGVNSIAGTDSGLTYTPSSNFDLLDRNLLTTDNKLQYFAGGETYRFPELSKWFNNKSTNTNFLRVQLFETASFGVARVNSVNHYGFTAGIGANYMLNNSGSWNFGGSGEYAQFPGYPSHVIVKLGVTFRFK